MTAILPGDDLAVLHGVIHAGRLDDRHRSPADPAGAETLVCWPRSACGGYDHGLVLDLGQPGPVLIAVGVNPSAAGDGARCPTTRNLATTARGAGFGSLALVNPHDVIATDPSGLRGHPNPSSPRNPATLALVLDAAAAGTYVVACWGDSIGYVESPDARSWVAKLMAGAGSGNILCLGWPERYKTLLTSYGNPRHPAPRHGGAPRLFDLATGDPFQLDGPARDEVADPRR